MIGLLRRLLRSTFGDRERRFIEKHVRTIVCSLCGEGSEVGVPSHLVRVDVQRPGPGRDKRNRAPYPMFYRHGDPRTCTYFMHRRAAMKKFRLPRLTRALAA